MRIGAHATTDDAGTRPEGPNRSRCLGGDSIRAVTRFAITRVLVALVATGLVSACGDRAPVGTFDPTPTVSPQTAGANRPSLTVNTGPRLLAADEDRQVIVVSTYRESALIATDLQLSNPKRQLLSASGTVTGAAFDHRTGVMYAATSRGELWRVSLGGPSQRTTIGPNPGAVIVDLARSIVRVADLGAGSLGGSIRTFQVDTLAPMGTVDLPGRPLDLFLDEARSRLYVSLPGSRAQPGMVSILDATTLGVIANIPIGSVTSLALTPDGSRLYALQRAELDPSNGVTAGKLWSIDPDDPQRRRSIDLANPAALAVTDSRVFVADYDTGSILVLESDRIVLTVPGVPHPTDLVALANGKRIYVSSIDDLSVRALDIP